MFLQALSNITVLVKQMIHNKTIENQERGSNLLHEAKVISALGYHPNLPLILVW